MWLFVHIMLLVGHRNRVVVLINWAWSYVTFKRGIRLITVADWKEAEGIPAPARPGPGTPPLHAGPPVQPDGSARIKT
jgi:NADH dehydrogenase